MRIALVNSSILGLDEVPLSDSPSLDAIVKPQAREFREKSPNDSLLALAALTPPEHELVYMDDQYGSIDFDAGIDLAAISAVTMNAARAYEMAAAFRERGVHVAMGGIHATLLPEEASLHVDTVFTGDADEVWPLFLSDLSRGRAKNRYDGGCAEITRSPPPRLNLLSPSQYFRKAFGAEVYSIRTTSGCTRRCRFCSNRTLPGKDRIHRKTLRQVEVELKAIASFAGPCILGISDDNLFVDERYAASVLRLVRDYGFTWTGSGDVSVVGKPEIMNLLEESRCRLLCFGLESLSAKNLRWIAPWKARQLPHYREAIAAVRDCGVNPIGSFIAGLENDGPDVFDRIMDFSLESGLSGVNVGLLVPFPNTEARERLVREGRLDEAAPWSKYTGYNLLYRHDRMSSEEALHGLESFYRRMVSPELKAHFEKVNLKPRTL